MLFFLKDFKLSKAGGHYWAEQTADISTLRWVNGEPCYTALEKKESEIHAIDSDWGQILTAYFNGELTEETWEAFHKALKGEA